MWSQPIKYELLERLGEGGQGCVFKALRRDPATGLSETVALKVLHSETAHSLWKGEFESLRQVRSPYCIQVLSFDRVGGRPALVLEFVDGVSLLNLGRSGLLEEPEIEELVAQIERALLDLKACGIFHGDLSPANVLVDRDGRVKLLDFGVANTGGREGRLTPDFAAPERLAGAEPALASDLYSLGAIKEFLLGHAVDLPQYLSRDPNNRQPLGLKTSSKRRKQLASKVWRWQQRNRLAQLTPTKTYGGKPSRAAVFPQGPIRWRIGRGWGTAISIFVVITLLCLSPGAVPHYASMPPPAVLIIRTLTWHKFQLNGRPLGYAPILIPIETASPAVLEWSSPHGHGRKVLRLRAGQRIVMGDRDFAH